MKNYWKNFVEKLGELNELREKQEKRARVALSAKLPKSVSHAPQQVEISIPTGAIIKVLFFVAIFFALGKIVVQLENIITITTICLFLALGLSPAVGAMERKKIPRPLSILIIYILFLGCLGILFYNIVPIVGQQLLSLSKDAHDFFSESQQFPIVNELLARFDMDPTVFQTSISEHLAAISKNLQGITGSTLVILTEVFQGVFNFVFALVVLFFMLMEREQIGNFILALFPERDRAYLREKISSVQEKMADWFQGQLILMISIGLAMYVGMKIFEYSFGMQYAATIGLLAGFMELFPYIGVLITGIFAGLIALNLSVAAVFAVIGWMILIQFLEGNLLVPIVMERVTGLPSVVVILALAIAGVLGSAIGGLPLAILGMILSIPLAASIGIFVQEYAQKNH